MSKWKIFSRYHKIFIIYFRKINNARIIVLLLSALIKRFECFQYWFVIILKYANFSQILQIKFYCFNRKNTFINNNTYWNMYLNSTCNTQLKKEKENENQTMTSLSKCLYKGMKIDPLDRFLEGKINICLYYRYGIKAIK